MFLGVAGNTGNEFEETVSESCSTLSKHLEEKKPGRKEYSWDSDDEDTHDDQIDQRTLFSEEKEGTD